MLNFKRGFTFFKSSVFIKRITGCYAKRTLVQNFPAMDDYSLLVVTCAHGGH